MLKERRKHRRVKTHMDCVLYNKYSGEDITGYVDNISVNGLGIVVENTKWLKEEMECTVQVIKKFIFDEEESINHFPIQIVRISNEDGKFMIGAIIDKSMYNQISSYVHKIDTEHFYSILQREL